MENRSAYDLSLIPFAPAPPGQVSNLVDGPSRTWIPHLAIYTTLPLSVVFLFLRLGARYKLRQSPRLDDCESHQDAIMLVLLSSSNVAVDFCTAAVVSDLLRCKASSIPIEENLIVLR